VVQRELEEWTRPVITVDGQTREYPRMAGISSFGAGGANAHVVIQEHVPSTEQPLLEITPAIIVLSARDEEQLKERVRQLLDALQNEAFADADLPHIAYTLQVGREAMEQRLALLAGSVQQVCEKLRAYLQSGSAEDLYRNEVRCNKEALGLFTADEDLQDAIAAWVQKHKYENLLDLWVKGLAFDWDRLYGQVKPRRVSLPAYPFAKQRYWIAPVDARGWQAGRCASHLHPLLHENASYLGEQRYRSVFGADEFFLRDHQVMGSRVLPAVVYLEMARAALSNGAEVAPQADVQMQLKNVVWSRPLSVGAAPAVLYTALYEQVDGRGASEIHYEIYSETPERERTVHSQGAVAGLNATDNVTLDIEQLLTRESRELAAEQCYETFRASGLEYGPAHRALQSLRVGDGFVLARLAIPSTLESTTDRFVLHPSVLDGALQAAIGLTQDDTVHGHGAPMLPYALDELQVLGKGTATTWAYLHESAMSSERLKKLDLQLCDENGRVWLRMRGLSLRALEKKQARRAPSAALLLKPDWRVSTLSSAPASLAPYDRRWIVFAGTDVATEQGAAEFERLVPTARCVVLKSAAEGLEHRFTDYAVQLLSWVKEVLNSRPKQPVLIQLVIGGANRTVLRSLYGLLKTAQLENPKLLSQVIELEGAQPMEALVERLGWDALKVDQHEIRYRDGQRWVAGLQEVEA
jgi:polyketide synthase PksN